ncbi:CHASE2 domain-containing protein [Leptolyngbyaceae cyanobacterium UHCC 1019]
MKRSLQESRRSNQFAAESTARFRKFSLSAMMLGGLGLLGVLATGLEWNRSQRWEQQVQVLFFELRGTVSPPPQIVIVAIDDASLSAAETYGDDAKNQQLVRLLSGGFPWRREAYAKAIDYLMQAGARSVSIDLLFDSQSRFGAVDDDLFRQALLRYPGKVTLAAFYTDAVPGALDFVQPTQALLNPSVQLGLVNFLNPEADGLVRRLGSAYQSQVIRPLNLQSVPSFAEATLQAAKSAYPAPKGDRIYFYGETHTIPHISFWRLLATDWQQVFRQDQTFRNKIVLIGTAGNVSEQDLFRTPFDDRLPGVELHANAIATLLEGRAIAEVFPNPWAGAALVAGLTIGLGVILLRLTQRPVWQLLVGCGVAISWVGFAYLAFTYGYWIVPIAVPFAVMVLSAFSTFTIGFVSDRLETLRLRRTLERYIAAPVVREILRRPEAMAAGKTLNAAVLFADIRGFTSLSYKLPPEQLIAQLNRYFNVMVEVILQEGGTVDKFIGDAVMAEFGFPVPQGEHQDALNAVRAALGMRRALADLRSQFHQEGLVPFFNGIGISYGTVIAGDLGALERREYGVIGDTVNVASRVEGLTKQLGTDILVTESIYQLVAEKVDGIDLGEHQLRGRDEPLRLFGIIGLKGDDSMLYQQVAEEIRNYLHP